ncbi:MAG TPA: bifunctional hydroxymethylpyrimidine kinase/phosphomethylpyrimidine kinase, partial [Pyrinomonadaceae bacterium]
TSLTYQNTTGVFGAAHQSATAVRAQVLPVVEDFRVAAAKTGMLPTREVIREVARLFRETDLPAPVVDPVVRSTSGYDLIDDEALAALRDELLPLARLLTPNIPEAERLCGMRIENRAGMLRAAQSLRGMGARAVLVKGGHPFVADGGDAAQEAADLLLEEDERALILSAPRVASTSTHGTGCTLAAAIAACLARGMELKEATATAKRYVTEAIRRAPGLGRGHGPVNHAVVPRVGAWGALGSEERYDEV